MTRDEVIDLLTLVASFDRRTVGNTDVAAWKLAIGDLGFAEAQAAVVAHFSVSTEWLAPAHVRQRVKAARADRLARTPVDAPPAEAADNPHDYRRAVQDGVRRIADGMDIARAIGPGRRQPSAPSAEWIATREAMGHQNARLTPEEIALEQVAESRRDRYAEWDTPDAGEEGA